MRGLFEQLQLCTIQPADSGGTCFSHSTWNILRKTTSASLYKCEESCWCLLHPCKYQQIVHADNAKRQNGNLRSFPRSPLRSKPWFSSFVAPLEWIQQFGDLQRKKQQPNKELPVVLDTLKLEGVAYQSSVPPGINRRNALVMWPNKTCDSGVLGQQTQQMVHSSKDLTHISVLQLNSSVHRNTVEHSCRRLPTGAGAGKAIYLHTSSSPAVTPLTIWIIPDKPLFEITGLQIKLGHPCKNKQIHGSPKKSIFS